MAKLCIVAGPGGDNVKQMIIQEAKEFFETVTYVSIKKVRIALENGKSQAFYKDTSLDSFDAVWARGFFEDYRLMEILLDILEESTVFLVNSTEGFQVCNHKYLSIQAAVRLGLPVPDSYICVSPKIANELAEKIGFPAVVKLLSGFGGKGVMLANSKKEFLPLLETLTLFREFITGQEFVASEATDYRVLIIGSEVLGIRRKGAEGEWRANVSTGGNAEFVPLDSELIEMAKAIASYLNMRVCSVDFLKTSQKKHVLIEVNFTPGMLQKIFKNQIAQKILAFIKKNVEERKKESA